MGQVKQSKICQKKNNKLAAVNALFLFYRQSQICLFIFPCLALKFVFLSFLKPDSFLFGSLVNSSLEVVLVW